MMRDFEFTMACQSVTAVQDCRRLNSRQKTSMLRAEAAEKYLLLMISIIFILYDHSERKGESLSDGKEADVERLA